MQIEIIDVMENQATTWVYFKTKFGCSKAIWSDNNKPIKQHEYFVEVDIDNILSWDENVQELGDNTFSLGQENNNVYFTGIIESIDSDGYTIIRLANDTMIPIMLNGNSKEVGKFVKVITKDMKLTNYSVP